MHEMNGLSELSQDAPAPMVSRSLTADALRTERRRREWLSSLVETEVLPRLLDAHQAKPRCVNARPAPRPPDPDGLVLWLRDGRIAEAFAHVEARLQSGATAQDLMIEDLGPAAQKFGRLWDDDECDILDVTMAVGALQGLLREIAPPETAHSANKPSILLLATPGETHAFGLAMVESFFRSSGWRTFASEGSSFVSTLARSAFDAVGFSLSCERFAESLRCAIAQARAASRNPRVKILVGGAIFGQKPELARKLGADSYSATAEAAIHVSRALLSEFSQTPPGRHVHVSAVLVKSEE